MMSGNPTDSIDFSLVPSALENEPPAHKLVFVALSIEGPSTARELESTTELSESSVHRALTALGKRDAVATVSTADGRRVRYRISAP